MNFSPSVMASLVYKSAYMLSYVLNLSFSFNMSTVLAVDVVVVVDNVVFLILLL